MNALEQAVFTGSCLRHAVPALARPRLWSAWWPLAVAQVAWLAAVVWFAHPAVSGWMVPLLSGLAGPEVVHYPNVFRILPGLHARGAFLAYAIVGPVVAGAAAIAFDDWFSGRRVSGGRALGAAFRRAPALIAAQAPVQVALLALTFGLAAWLEARGSSGLVVRIVTFGSLGASVLTQALFLYVPAYVTLGGCGPLAAWRELPRSFSRAGTVALLLVGLASLLGTPLQFAARMAEPIVERGRPELVVAVVVAQVVAGLLAAFVLAGGALLAYRSLLEPAEEDA